MLKFTIVKIDTLRILPKCFKILVNQFREWHIHMYKRYRMLTCMTNAVANFTNALRMKQQHDTCVLNLYAYKLLPVFLFFLYFPAPAQSAYSHSNFSYCPHSSLLANFYKCLTIIVINENGLQLLKNMLRICFPYGI